MCVTEKILKSDSDGRYERSKLLNPLGWLYRTLSLFPLHYFRLSHTSGMIDAQIERVICCT